MGEEISSLSLMKHFFSFRKIFDNPELFLKEELLSISELINLMTFFELSESKKRTDSEIDKAFRKYYKLYSEGIVSGKLRTIPSASKKTTPFLSQFADIIGGCTETFLLLMHKMHGINFDKINIGTLNKCVNTNDAILFTIRNGYAVPFFFVDYIKHHSPDAIKIKIVKDGDNEIAYYSLVDQDNSPLPKKDDPDASLWLDRLTLHGIDTNLLLPEMSLADLQQLSALTTPRETPDPPNLARKNTELRCNKIKALNFMLISIHTGCNCNHVNLAKFALNHQNEWLAFDRPLSQNQLKEISICIVPPNRRYRKNQHTEAADYDPSACKCDLPNHS